MRIGNNIYTIGADPELFIAKGGSPYSAYGLIKGDKANPHRVKDGAVQVDGMALEFNVDPSETKEDFLGNIESVKSQLLSMVDGFDIVEDCSVVFDVDYFKRQPHEAVELGCEPDFNAYTGKFNTIPDGNTTMRTAGGHVHIGGIPSEDIFSQYHFTNCKNLTKAMDEQLGVYSILWDRDDSRRSMYGKASSFRPKNYGVEYRTLSNSWVFNKGLIELVYDFTKDALSKFLSGEESNPECVDIINNSNLNSSFFNNNSKADRVMKIMEG